MGNLNTSTLQDTFDKLEFRSNSSVRYRCIWICKTWWIFRWWKKIDKLKRIKKYFKNKI